MAIVDINGIQHRIIDGETYDWLDGVIDARLKDTAWYNVAHKAAKHLLSYPVKFEALPDGTYQVAVASESEPGREHIANLDECECQGNRRHGHCFHRMLCRILEWADRFENRREAQRKELARRVVTPVLVSGATKFAASYDGAFVALVDTADEARERIEEWLAQRALLQQAQVAA